MATLLEPNAFHAPSSVSVGADLRGLLRVAVILLVFAAISTTVVAFRVGVYAARHPMAWTAPDSIEQAR